MSLTACGTATSDVRLRCPPLTQYTQATQDQVADEKTTAEKTGAAWPALIDDYHQLRGECRAIAKDTLK